jgi:hypothetical protein
LLEGCPIVTVPAIPQRALLASSSFGPGLDAVAVLAAIAQGLRAGGRPEPDLCPLEPPRARQAQARELLDALGFDARLRAARAVILATERLHKRTLAGSVTFEIATRARQGGIPAYAVTTQNALDPFDARILDLQLILEASTSRALTAAGRKLAGLM